MRSSYREEDVKILLKDITGLVKPQPAWERERLIQSGKHYCEMLPVEYVPTRQYMQAYEDALEHFAASTAQAVAELAGKIIEERGTQTVLVSLARAGIPAGILLKRYLKWNAGIELPHYAVSIIRGRGIDHNAMKYLLKKYQPGQLLFVDGWIGKGAILRELEKCMEDYPGVSPQLAVLADPAGVTQLCGTHEDILIPSSCLNCTVSGLISRTFLRSGIIGENDFHGAVYYEELRQADLSYAFIEAVQQHFVKQMPGAKKLRQDTREKKQNAASEAMACSGKEGAGDSGETCATADVTEAKACSGMDEVRDIAGVYGVSDLNFIKPGIGETTRVLLRRVPWKVLIAQKHQEDRALKHILRLAEEKGVPVEVYPLKHYKCCGIIRKLSDV